MNAVVMVILLHFNENAIWDLVAGWFTNGEMLITLAN